MTIESIVEGLVKFTPSNIGTVIRAFGTYTQHTYIISRGVDGIWKSKDDLETIDTFNDQDILKILTNPSIISKWEVLSEGYVEPIEEPLGLGAVVSCGGIWHLRVLNKDNFSWARIPFDDSWFSWDELTRRNKEIKVLSEGVL